MIGEIKMQEHVNFIHRSLVVSANKKNALVILSAILFSGCGTNMPTQKTGNANEYVINRDDKSPFGNLPSVKKSVSIDATKFCEAMNKKSVEKYSIDKERAVFVWPESTLYFECVEPIQDAELNRQKLRKNADSAIEVKKDNRIKDEPQKYNYVYSELVKLDELRKKGILTDSEFDDQKKKLLSGD